jgi:hypothetical protein
MSQALDAVKSTSAMKIGAFGGSVSPAIRRNGVAARRIAAPRSDGAQQENCRYSCELLFDCGAKGDKGAGRKRATARGSEPPLRAPTRI